MSTPNNLNRSCKMAKFRGNIWTKAAGSIGSITFSKARNRSGKVQTARERVVPLNPQTPGQVSARQELASSNFIAKNIGPSLYEADWDRTISKLPGYQSLVSSLQRATHSVGTQVRVNQNIPPVQLGGLHYPESVVYDHVVDSVWSFDYSTELGQNGSPDDILIMIGIQINVEGVDVANREVQVDSGFFSRDDGFAEIDMQGAPGTDTEVYIITWFRPAATNSFQQPSQAVFQTLST